MVTPEKAKRRLSPTSNEHPIDLNTPQKDGGKKTKVDIQENAQNKDESSTAKMSTKTSGNKQSQIRVETVGAEDEEDRSTQRDDVGAGGKRKDESESRKRKPRKLPTTPSQSISTRLRTSKGDSAPLSEEHDLSHPTRGRKGRELVWDRKKKKLSKKAPLDTESKASTISEKHTSDEESSVDYSIPDASESDNSQEQKKTSGNRSKGPNPAKIAGKPNPRKPVQSRAARKNLKNLKPSTAKPKTKPTKKPLFPLGPREHMEWVNDTYLSDDDSHHSRLKRLQFLTPSKME